MSRLNLVLLTIASVIWVELVALEIWARSHPFKVGKDYPYTKFKLPDEYGIPYDSVQIFDPFDSTCQANLIYQKTPNK